MKIRIQSLSILLLLVLVLGLFGCTSGDETTSTTDNTSPTVTTPALVIYNKALQNIEQAKNLVLTYQYTQTRTVGSDTFTTDISGTDSYAGLASEDMQIVVDQSISFGTYATQYTELYSAGKAYACVNGCNFAQEMTDDGFTERQFPSVLLDATLYQSITTEETENGTTIYFSDAIAPESWEADPACVSLLSASGTVLLDQSGKLRTYTYCIKYTWGVAVYQTEITMDVSVTKKSPFADGHPGYPEEYVTLSSLDAPKLLLRSVGDIMTAQSFTSQVNQLVNSAALDLVRSDYNTYSISGSGNDLIASADFQVTLSDYRGATSTSTQSDRYENGIFTRISNGNIPVETSETPENIRIKWENYVLNDLFSLAYLSDATLTETDDFYYLDFSGNDAYCDTISGNLNTIFASDLDGLSSSYTNTQAGGYLTINKQTGLPTSMGMSFARTHVHYGVYYPLTYQLDQSLYISSPAEGDEAAADPEQSSDIEQATPLFYHITGEDGQEMWLIGTIHAGDSRMNNLPNEIYNALRSCDALAVEYDINEFLLQTSTDSTLQNTIADLYYYLDGSTVYDHLSEEVYQDAYYLLTASGDANTSTDYMRPVFIASLIEEFYLEQGYRLSSDMGMDLKLLELARSMDKRIISIESGLSQLQILSSLSDELQQLLLESALNSSISDYNDSVNELYELWCQGDLDGLLPLLFSDDNSTDEAEQALWQEYDQALITDRNATMLSTAIDCLEGEETVFYAVGLAHLLGDSGLLQSLEDAGYTVTMVSYT